MDIANPSVSSLTSTRRPLALMWRGNLVEPGKPTNHAERFRPLVAELTKLGIETRQVVYYEEEAEAAHEALLQAGGVLVWINPLQDGRNRTEVDKLLRDVASHGVWVSAHPDTIDRMGTKEVLYLTRELGWGADTDLYRSLDELVLRLPVKLAVAGPRVLKPQRGNDGKGVIKVERIANGEKMRVQAASDDGVEILAMPELAERLAQHFDKGGCIVAQAFNDNARAGMVRCYMSQDRVAGFSEQAPRRNEDAFGMNSAKKMHGAEAPAFQDLRDSMERDWTPGLQRLLGLEAHDLPALWDADFLHRPPGFAAASRFFLCEINVSSVSPFPDTAAPVIAATAKRMLEGLPR